MDESVQNCIMERGIKANGLVMHVCKICIGGMDYL